MRDILFRGKHIHAHPKNEHLDGTWVYGYLCDENYINSSELEGEFLINPETVCQYTGLTDSTKWEKLSENEKEKFLSEWNRKENRQNTKEDWNGRKIFEGDIISKRVNIYSLGGMKPTGERVLVGTVIWDESSAIYPGGWSIKAKDEHGNDTAYAFDNGFEIIGNIFDNPELIDDGM